MHDNDILIDIDLDENAPPVTYATETERVTRVSTRLTPLGEPTIAHLREIACKEEVTIGELWYVCNALPNLLVSLDKSTSELARLEGQVDAIRTEWHMVHATCPVPVFVRDWFKGLGLLIEGGE